MRAWPLATCFADLFLELVSELCVGAVAGSYHSRDFARYSPEVILFGGGGGGVGEKGWRY